jgi:hypothetical protein
MAKTRDHAWQISRVRGKLTPTDRGFAPHETSAIKAAIEEFDQPTISNPLMISITTAVPPCTPNATVLLPP